MTFFDTARPDRASNFRKTEFVELSPGQTFIRIIDTSKEAKKFFTHYIKGVSILCLGEDCPVCRNNTRIYAENPESYRDIPGWSPRQERFAVNVFDKTPVKTCPNCNVDVKKTGNSFTPVCPKCGQPIVEVVEHPLNKVKVLAKGVTVAELLNGIDASILDENGDKVGINNFDIALYITGSGKTQTISPIPLVDKRDPISYNPEDKFDLDKVAIELTPEEIGNLISGISLKDIFAARRKGPSDPDFLGKEIAEATADIKETIANLLNN